MMIDMKNHPKAIGEKTQAIILAELIKRDYIVLLPFGDNQRYDLVLHQEDKFIRVQCKTGRLRNGAILFNASSVAVNSKGYKTSHYDGQVDIFAVYCPTLDKVYLVPISETTQNNSSRTTALRVEKAKNNQSNKVRLACNYELI